MTFCPLKPKAVLSAKFNPKSLTELSANKLEQMIQPKMTKPKSLVQLAAEKIEQAIKQPRCQNPVRCYQH